MFGHSIEVNEESKAKMTLKLSKVIELLCYILYKQTPKCFEVAVLTYVVHNPDRS